MNERIREIVNKAISDVDYIRDDDFTNEELSKMYIPDCFAEKFAELIVKECGAYLNSPEFIGRSDLDWSMVLNEHFGVEE